MPWRGVEPAAGQAVPPQPWHSIAVSALPPDQPVGGETLERSLKALTRYYRHSSVGQRCLGIVHQMNTPMQVLTFELDLLEEKIQAELAIHSQSPPAQVEKLQTLLRYRQGKLQQLREQLDKLRLLTRNLVLQGAHEDAQEKFHLDLNQVLRQELEHYQAHSFFRHQVSKNFHFQEGLPLIHGFYIDFSQSFRNIIDNALEAMAGMECRRLTVMTASQDNWLLVRVGDTGRGIPPQDLPWIFEPFFTTKALPDGEHAGLGLFMVRRLLALYRAELRADSVPGQTWLSVAFPLA
ncbi:MAG: HAMP domain-containing histidine kinase [Syntrophobacterales bacterium]|nr:HAMP domain-containing histidine kinase [Syntrophobacterales bacterium]